MHNHVAKIQKHSYVLMKLEPHIIVKLYLNFSNFEPQYSYKYYSCRKECTHKPDSEHPEVKYVLCKFREHSDLINEKMEGSN